MTRQFARIAIRLGIALGAAAMLFPAQTTTATARASGTNLEALIARSLDSVHSFKVVTDSSTKHVATSPGGVMQMHSEEIFIRRGTGYTIYMQVTTDGKYNATVYTGMRYCIKRGAAARWSCSTPPAYLKSILANLDPVKGFKASGVITSSVIPVGTKSIRGQSCTGYRFAMSLKDINLTGRGIVWFSAESGRLVQLDETSSAKLVAGTPALVTTGTTMYSRWNDGSLSLPRLPV